MIRQLAYALTIPLSVLLCLGAMRVETLAQPEGVEGRVLRAIASGDGATVEQVFESTQYDVRRSIGKTHGFSVFYFAMFCDNVDVFRAVMRRALPVTPDDLRVAAGTGNSAQFLAVLRAARWRELDHYRGGAELLAPMSSTTRDAVRSMVLETRDVDFEAIKDHPPAATDINTLNLWIERLKSIAPAGIVSQLLIGEAIDATLNQSTNGSDHLLQLYLFDEGGPLGNGYSPRRLKRAFEQGKWRIVDALIQRGAPVADLTNVEVSRITDPDRALGYFVRLQVVDPVSNPEALRVNRAWDLSKIGVQLLILDTKGRAQQHQVPWTDEWVNLFGGLVDVRGMHSNQLRLSMSGGSQDFARIFITINNKGFEEFIEGSATAIRVVIPPSDKSMWGEYHGVLIKNHATFVNGINILNKSIEKNAIEVYLGEARIEVIPVGDEVLLNRALGALELRIPIAAGQTFGFSGDFTHRLHDKITDASDLRVRLLAYIELMGAVDAAKESGTASSSDARTVQRLVSEQLRESNVPDTVRESLRIALQTLSEQSVYDAAFTNYVLAQTQELPALLGNVPTEVDPTLRTQLNAIRTALDIQNEKLRFLSDQNILNYEKAVRRVENLMYELAQYYSRDELERQLSRIVLTPAARGALHRNVQESAAMVHIKRDDLSGKGEVLRRFLNIQ